MLWPGIFPLTSDPIIHLQRTISNDSLSIFRVVWPSWVVGLRKLSLFALLLMVRISTNCGRRQDGREEFQR